jgi:hypothetical protein
MASYGSGGVNVHRPTVVGSPSARSKFLACLTMACSASPLAASSPSMTTDSSRSPLQIFSTNHALIFHPCLTSRGMISWLMARTRSSPEGSGTS